MKRYASKIESSGPTGLGSLAPFVYCLWWFLGTWAVFRAIYLCVWIELAIQEPDLWKILPTSLRFDFLTFSYGIGGWILLIMLTPAFLWKRGARWFWQKWMTMIYGFVVFLEVAAWPFLKEYGNRPDRHALEFWNSPREVVSMLAKGFKFEIAVGLVVSSTLAYFFHRRWKKVLTTYHSYFWPVHIFLWILLLVVFIAGGRSSLGHRPANISSASFSNEHIVNQLTLNSAYSLIYAGYRLRHEENPTTVYGKRPIDEMLARLKQRSELDGKIFTGPPKDFSWQMPASAAVASHPNIFLVVEESLGAEFIGSLGGMNLSPFIDAKAKEALMFTQMYSTGTRTARGLEALVAGFPPTPGTSVLKLGKAYHSFFTMATALKPFGYKSYFFCGGDGNFDEMKSFFMSNGFDKFLDLGDLKDEFASVGSWGVHDADLLEYAHKYVNNSKEPFLAVVMTSSNHSPFDYPVGEFQPHPEYPKESHPNAVLYADFSLGKWFKLIEQSSYKDNTLFTVVADHSTRVYGDKLIPIHKFHIPALMWGPGVPTGTFDKIASQIDIPVTLLGLTGLPIKSPMVGFDLFKLPATYPGRSLMQYAEHLGYRVGDNVMILRPGLSPELFNYSAKGDFTSLPLDPEMVEDAYAYSLGTWALYDQQLYR